MKFIILFIGIFLAGWVSFTVYPPLNTVTTGLKEYYISSQITLKKAGTTIDKVTSTTAYQEIAKMFGIEQAKEAVKSPSSGNKAVIGKLFDYNLALWISVFCGLLTLSIYFNVVAIIAFFFKPVTFFMKK
jgi:hypothetical protein